MTAAAAFICGLSGGFTVCWLWLVRPMRKLLNRWMKFYNDDIKAAQRREAESKRTPVSAKPKTGDVI